MAPSHRDPEGPDEDWNPESESESGPEPEPEPEPVWRPDPPWEPEPEPTPWSEREAEAEGSSEWEPPDRRDAVSPIAPVDAPRSSFAPAYLAAAALMVVLFALGLLTVGLHGRGRWARVILVVGSALLLLGLAMMGLATWLVGGLERG